MPLTPQSQSFEHAHRSKISTVCNGNDTMQISYLQKGIVQNACCRFRGISFALKRARDSKAELALPRIGFVYLQGAVANQRSCFLQLGCELKPMARIARFNDLLIVNKVFGLLPAH